MRNTICISTITVETAAQKWTVMIVQKAKKGKWLNHHALWIGHEAIEGWFLQAQCSLCKRYADKLDPYCRFIDYEYCPHCGAKMSTE